MSNHNEWGNNNKCMAYNINNKQICTHEIKKQDFCKYHMRYKKYYQPLLTEIRLHDINLYNIDINVINKEKCSYISNKNTEKFIKIIQDKINNRNNILDEKYKHNLMMLYDSWSEVPLMYQIKLNNEWWELTSILQHITQQLNQSDMENPFPMYPSNPFTRGSFEKSSIINIKNTVNAFKININIVLECFLNTNTNTNTNNLINIFSKKLRFKLINNKNSQNCFIGKWVPKNMPLSQFETTYELWKDTPYQIYHRIYGLIDNEYKEFLYVMLTNLPPDS